MPRRYTLITEKQNGHETMIPGCFSLIAEIMRRGQAVSSLEYTCEMTGDQIRALLVKYDLEERFGSQIVDENTYIVTAYDW